MEKLKLTNNGLYDHIFTPSSGPETISGLCWSYTTVGKISGDLREVKISDREFGETVRRLMEKDFQLRIL
jgi:hypothetical protein